MDDYTQYVEHPRYGRGPRFTNLRPREVPLGYRLTTYLSSDKIEGTAVEANVERQAYSPIPALFYFDLKRQCLECGRQFVFFAEEQRHWYETLGFSLDADCRRCVDCRRRQHGLERLRRRYEELFHQQCRTAAENLEMAECAMGLIESGQFHLRQTERVRSLLRAFRGNPDETCERRYGELIARVRQAETTPGEG
jgi:hypothetical protein